MSTTPSLPSVDPDGCDTVSSPTTPLPTPLPPRRRVTVDHRFFPHIIDLIWSFMPYPSLVVCTMVCKTWSSKARKRLFRHVSVGDVNEDSQDVIIRSRNVEWPRHSAVLKKTRERHVVKCLEAAETVDLLPSCSDRCYNLDQDSGRKRARLHIPPGARMHCFPHLNAASAVCFIDFSADYRLGQASTVCAHLDLTLSLNCYSNPTAPITAPSPHIKPWLPDFCPDTHLRFATIILNDLTAQEPPSPRPGVVYTLTPRPPTVYPWLEGRNAEPLGVVFKVLRFVVTLSLKRIRIVGVEAFLEEEGLESYCHQVRDSIDREVAQFWGTPLGHHCYGDSTEFLTHEHYRELVGDEQYYLETLP